MFVGRKSSTMKWTTAAVITRPRALSKVTVLAGRQKDVISSAVGEDAPGYLAFSFRGTFAGDVTGSSCFYNTVIWHIFRFCKIQFSHALP